MTTESLPGYDAWKLSCPEIHDATFETNQDVIVRLNKHSGRVGQIVSFNRADDLLPGLYGVCFSWADPDLEDSIDDIEYFDEDEIESI